MARKTQDYVCIACPIGCPLQLVHRGNTIEEVSGHNCKRGSVNSCRAYFAPRLQL